MNSTPQVAFSCSLGRSRAIYGFERNILSVNSAGIQVIRVCGVPIFDHLCLFAVFVLVSAICWAAMRFRNYDLSGFYPLFTILFLFVYERAEHFIAQRYALPLEEKYIQSQKAGSLLLQSVAQHTTRWAEINKIKVNTVTIINAPAFSPRYDLRSLYSPNAWITIYFKDGRRSTLGRVFVGKESRFSYKNLVEVIKAFREAVAKAAPDVVIEG